MSYYLGVDIGGTKSHAMIVDMTAEPVGFGFGGAGNHENVGFDGLRAMLKHIVGMALVDANLKIDDIQGAGFGLCGFDWESEREAHLDAVSVLGLQSPIEIVNDAVLGIVAAAENGWGVCVVAGTGCNAWGRDKTGRLGHVIGMGNMVGESAGGGELVLRAMWKIAQAYTLLSPPTLLSKLFVDALGASSSADLLESYTEGRIHIDARYAPLVFYAALEGDQIAQELIEWAGTELGNLAIAVIRQLALQSLSFDVVQSGSLYKGGYTLHEYMEMRIHQEAPQARLVRLNAPPVVGAVLLGMEQANLASSQIHKARQRLAQYRLPKV